MVARSAVLVDLLLTLGVKHVINLALHTYKRALSDEAGTVTASGMTYNHFHRDPETTWSGG